jgi:hypothetical protein
MSANRHSLTTLRGPASPPRTCAVIAARALPLLALIVLQATVAGCGGGSSKAINPPPPAPSDLTYPQASISATVGAAIATDTPTVTGSVAGYTIAPALPAGLGISASTGAISGTPTAASAQTSYTVTASNSSGSATATISITVAAAIAAPSNLVYPQSSISATVGTAIATDTPTVTGTVSSYTTSPTLPAGLSIDSSTGVISGTPTAVAAQASYTVTASNSAGSTTAAISIAVAAAVPPPSNLAYPHTSISATVGAPIATDMPTVTGEITGFTIAPSLPAGLTIDSGNGAISGTPTAASAKTSYTVTASNSGGSTTAAISIAVAPATAFLDLGQTASIASIRASATRVLTADQAGHWNLWNYTTGQSIANGDGALVAENEPIEPIDLAGNLAVVNTAAGVELFSADTGQQLITLPGGNWFKLATDGSYVCTGSSAGLTVWSPAGLQEFSRPGDYSLAKVFAAPGQVQVALGPAGAGVIETDSVPSGNSSASASFSGTFNSWSLDGQRFLTTLGTTVWVYSNAGVQQTVMSLAGILDLTAQGDWIWSLGAWNTSTNSYPLSVYAIGNNTPAATYPVGDEPYTSGLFIAINEQSNGITLIDLSGASPVSTDYTLPTPAYNWSAFGAYSASQWIVGNDSGVLLDGATANTTPRYFGYGAVTGLAASPNNIAIATAIGQILLYDPIGTTQQGTIPFLSGQLELSSDGSVLAAGAYGGFNQYGPDRTLNIYSLPSQSIIQTFPYTFNSNGTPFLEDFSLSASGQTLGQVLINTCARQVTGLSGSPVIWSDSGVCGPLVLSPDGTNIAAANEYDTSIPSSQPITNLWTNGALVTAIDAFPEGWIDDTHLLASNYALGYFEDSEQYVYTGSTIYDPSGNVIATLPASSFPSIANPQFTANGLAYDPIGNTVYSLSTGAPIWNGPPSPSSVIPNGALAGSNVVYVLGHQVFIAPY